MFSFVDILIKVPIDLKKKSINLLLHEDKEKGIPKISEKMWERIDGEFRFHRYITYAGVAKMSFLLDEKASANPFDRRTIGERWKGAKMSSLSFATRASWKKGRITRKISSSPGTSLLLCHLSKTLGVPPSFCRRSGKSFVSSLPDRIHFFNRARREKYCQCNNDF